MMTLNAKVFVHTCTINPEGCYEAKVWQLFWFARYAMSLTILIHPIPEAQKGAKGPFDSRDNDA